ncbi:MAG TPA: sensor histidine kinase [Candidatus Enterococcus stercoravium]|nr:sensor histidine kinase [Candidatus Enterococcus stercoravium]
MNSIKKKTILIFLATSLALITALTLTIHYELTRKTIPLNRSITQKFVDNRTSQINSWFGERLSELRLLASLSNTHEYQRESFFAETENLVATAPENYLSIRLVSKNGTSYSADPIIPSFSVRKRPYYLKMTQDPTLAYTVSNQLISKEDHQAAVVILYRLATPLADEITYIAAAVPLQKVMSLAKDLDLYDGTGILLGEESRPPKVDSKQQLLFTSEIDYLPNWQVNYIVSRGSLGASTQQLLRILQIVLVIVLLLLGVFLLLLFRGILRPIVTLRDTMLQVQAGDKTVRAQETGPTEIAQLATAFNTTLDKVYENEEKYRKASLRVLQEQIQPHFLYNTLNTIQWQIVGGDLERAVTMLENLSMYLRKGLNHGDELCRVADEIAHIRSYLAIQQVRHEELAEVSIHLPPELAEKKMLHFLLQPIVENAIDHGIRTQQQHRSRLWLTVAGTAAGLVLTVGNDGTPIAPEVLQQLNQTGDHEPPMDDSTDAGFGLLNVRRRLQLTYGNRAQMVFASDELATVVTIYLPYLEKGVTDEHSLISR